MRFDSSHTALFIRGNAMSSQPERSETTSALPCETNLQPSPRAAMPGQHKQLHLSSMLRSGLGWLPSLLVFVGLIALGWYGHNNDWKLPARQSAQATGGDKNPWCDSHGVPEAECIVCRPELMEESPELSFCKEHGVHGCVFCDPSLAETKQPTEPTREDLQRAVRALTLMPRTENLSIGTTSGSRIQFASVAAMRKAGVDADLVQRKPITETITAAGEIRYDATKTAQVSPPCDGIVRHVLVKVGDWVRPGQVLAMIDSAEAGKLKTALLAALAEERLQQAAVERMRLAGQAVAAKRMLESENDLQQAIAVVQQAVGALANLGIEVDLPDLRASDQETAGETLRRLGLGGEINILPQDIRSGNLIAVTAPLHGQVVQLATTIGQVVDRGSEMFRVVDTRRVWLDLRVAAEQAPLVQLSQTVHFWPDGQHHRRSGNVTWVSSEVEPQTRTVRVRAELANPDQNLRHESFGRGQIVLREESDAIAVPEAALQWDGSGQVIFVRDARFFEEDRPKFFVSRSVRTGARQDGFVEVIAGVLPGEVVATTGSDVLRAQLLRSNLGAGCTCGK